MYTAFTFKYVFMKDFCLFVIIVLDFFWCFFSYHGFISVCFSLALSLFAMFITFPLSVIKPCRQPFKISNTFLFFSFATCFVHVYLSRVHYLVNIYHQRSNNRPSSCYICFVFLDFWKLTPFLKLPWICSYILTHLSLFVLFCFCWWYLWGGFALIWI